MSRSSFIYRKNSSRQPLMLRTRGRVSANLQQTAAGGRRRALQCSVACSHGSTARQACDNIYAMGHQLYGPPLRCRLCPLRSKLVARRVAMKKERLAKEKARQPKVHRCAAWAGPTLRHGLWQWLCRAVSVTRAMPLQIASHPAPDGCQCHYLCCLRNPAGMAAL